MAKTKPKAAPFAVRLKALREAAGLTQAQLADRAGLVQSAVSHWEGGRRRPSLEIAYRLADALGVTVQDLR